MPIARQSLLLTSVLISLNSKGRIPVLVNRVYRSSIKFLLATEQRGSSFSRALDWAK